jgi:glycosyltransferase involved in cell wall biosynthesis
MLKEEKSILHKLVIAGKDDFATKEIIRSVKATDSANDIVFTGYVADQDLPSLYSEADVFIYPSLFEGVGLPVLEAMSCGVPVIASDSSSLTEILGDAGILVDPLNPAELMRAILQITSDQDLRDSYIAKGTARAENYTWASTAQRTLECYKSLNRC